MSPLLIALALTAALQTADTPDVPVTLAGRVADAKTGEPIAKALVSIREQRLQTETDDEGRFSLAGVSPGRVELYVSTVGYGLLKREIDVGAGTGPLDLRLGQEAIQRSEDVTVVASPFDRTETGAASEQGLDNSELKNLASVVADDALRSVQTLPGVTTGDDFNAVFAVRGSSFPQMGFYIDGVLTTAPFHTIRGIKDGFTLTILNGDLIDSVALLGSAAPAPYGDRTGAVLNVRTRDISRARRVTRASLGATGLSLTSEGPLGAKAAWLVAGRKSYLDYIINRIEEDPSFVLGWYDLQAKLTFDASPAHRFTLLGIHGDADYEENEPGQSRNSLVTAEATTQIVTAEWRWLPSARSVLKTRAYLDRETGVRRNRLAEPLDDVNARHTGYRSDLSLGLGSTHRLETGLFARRLNEAGHEQRFESRTQSFETLHDYQRATWQPSAYLQDTWTPNDRLSLTVGGRVDHLALTGETSWLPRAAVSVSLSKRTKVDAGWGRYGQFPGLAERYGAHGNPELTPARASHVVAGVERLLGDKVRVRVEAYYEDKDHFPSPPRELRTIDGRLAVAFSDTIEDTLRGSSRGFEILLQRRSANRLSGWVSYSWGHTHFEEDGTGIAFDGDYDQRHTVNAYGSYRLSNTWNLSAKYRYGSSMPILGFYEARGPDFFLAPDRNEARAPIYSRLDVRANKAFFFRRWKMTLYGEISNVLNRTHYRYTDLDRVNPQTGQVFIETDTLFPIVPAVGVSVEF
jgi:hypothetical protein